MFLLNRFCAEQFQNFYKTFFNELSFRGLHAEISELHVSETKLSEALQDINWPFLGTIYSCDHRRCGCPVRFPSLATCLRSRAWPSPGRPRPAPAAARDARCSHCTGNNKTWRYWHNDLVELLSYYKWETHGRKRAVFHRSSVCPTVRHSLQ